VRDFSNNFFLEEFCLDVLHVMRVHSCRCAVRRIAADAVLWLGANAAMVRLAMLFL